MRVCELCRAFAQVSRRCPSHAIADAISNRQDDLAYQIATDFGRPHSAVRILIRDRMERDLDASLADLRKSVASMEQTLAARKAA